MTAKKTKECPYCGEKIMETAIKCRFCGEFLDKQQQKATAHVKKEESSEKIDEYQEFGSSTGFLFLLWILALFLMPIYIGIFFACIAIIYHCQKIEIHKDHLVYKHGVFVKRREEIPYKKINSVDTKSFIFDDLIIRTGNDKPTIFKNVDECSKIVSIIKEKIN